MIVRASHHLTGLSCKECDYASAELRKKRLSMRRRSVDFEWSQVNRIRRNPRHMQCIPDHRNGIAEKWGNVEHVKWENSSKDSGRIFHAEKSSSAAKPCNMALLNTSWGHCARPTLDSSLIIGQLIGISRQSIRMIEITLFTINHREIKFVCIGEYLRLDRIRYFFFLIIMTISHGASFVEWFEKTSVLSFGIISISSACDMKRRLWRFKMRIAGLQIVRSRAAILECSWKHWIK
jgi:hypothetical protein